MRHRRASEVDTSFRLGCHQWSVFAARMQQLKSGGAAVARWGFTQKVENLFWFAVAVYGLCCPGKLHSPVSSLVRVPEYFQPFCSVGGFPPSFHPWFSLSLWAPLKALSKVGNIRNSDTSRIFPVTAHSEGKEAQKLDTFGEFRGSCFS